MSLRLPTRVSVIPELACAALKAGDEAVFCAWAVARRWDTDNMLGSGYLPRDVTEELVKRSLAIQKRQAQRILAAGAGRYWDLTGNHSLRLRSAEAVARAEGISWTARPHRVLLRELQGAGMRRATLIATNYRTDELGKPISRREIAERTGVSPATQRRLDREYRVAKSVTRMVASFGRQVSQFYADSIAQEFKGWGFFSGRGKRLYRRHADIRTAPTHEIGSSAAQRRLNRALRGERRPAKSSRGQRPPRTYFQGENAVQLWMKDKRARGKRASSAQSLHPLLDYSLVLGSPGPKRYRGVVLSETRVTGGASRLSGGLVHGR
jgi:hypothetical protein